MTKRRENDLDFYTRRAMEESRAAISATCPVTGAAHRHMAAAYAVRRRDEEFAGDDYVELVPESDAPAAERFDEDEPEMRKVRRG